MVWPLVMVLAANTETTLAASGTGTILVLCHHACSWLFNRFISVTNAFAHVAGTTPFPSSCLTTLGIGGRQWSLFVPHRRRVAHPPFGRSEAEPGSGICEGKDMERIAKVILA